MLKAIGDMTSSNHYRQLYLLSLGFMDAISSEQIISFASKYKEKEAIWITCRYLSGLLSLSNWEKEKNW